MNGTLACVVFESCVCGTQKKDSSWTKENSPRACCARVAAARRVRLEGMLGWNGCTKSGEVAFREVSLFGGACVGVGRDLKLQG